LNIPANATVILALGRLIEVKGLHVLAAAADAILAPRPNAHLVIAGDGPMRRDIESIVSRAACRDRIHLPGAVPRTDVARLMAEADLFVNPGITDSGGRAEGLGITTIEAMASGLPCVGSRVGGISETIVDDVTGLLVPPGNTAALAEAVGRLADDPALRQRMGSAAHEVARERFTWPVLAGQVAAVYREVLGAKASDVHPGLHPDTVSKPSH
jgi:glycosyltransferase involved in cell wall biosynthesis